MENCGIYLLLWPDGHYKVGFSCNVRRRRGQFTLAGIAPEILHVVAVQRSEHRHAERFFHNAFATFRISHECFRLGPSEVAWFRQFSQWPSSA